MAAPRLTGLTRARTARGAPDVRTDPVRDVVHRGRARLGKRTKLLVKRLKPGEVAVIEHADIDRVAADALVAAGVRCVLNARQSSSSHYPNSGPMILADAGVHLVDLPGSELFELLEDGDELVVKNGDVYRRGEIVASGQVLDREAVHRAYEHARTRIGEALAA